MKRVDILQKELNYEMREEMKNLRTNIQFCGDDKRVIVFTSFLAGEGKSTTSLNLAISLSELNKNVLFIDADIRKSVLVSRLGTGKIDRGLSHFLSGQCALTDVVYGTNISRLHMIFSGPVVPNPTELLASSRFAKALESFRGVYDYIIIDGAPLGMVVDSAIIAKECDGSIIVVESGSIKYRLVQEVRSKLENAGCAVLGVVLNKVDRKKNGHYYRKYYGKYYGKYEEYR